MKVKKQVEELEAALKRAVSDYQNLERIVNDQQQAFVKFANAVLIEKLLSIMDDLDRANEHIKDGGLKLVIERFKEVLKSEGVETISTAGQEFDPGLMECVEMVAGDKNRVFKTTA